MSLRPTEVVKVVLVWPALVMPLTLGVASCGGSVAEVSNGAPPTVICGTTLNNTASGAVVEDATQNHQVIRAVTSRSLIFVRLSDNCDSGATVTWTPGNQAAVVAEAMAKDGKPAAVAFRPASSHAKFRLRGTRGGHLVAWTSVDLGTG